MKEFSQEEKARMLEDVGLAPRNEKNKYVSAEEKIVDVKPADEDSY